MFNKHILIRKILEIIWGLFIKLFLKTFYFKRSFPMLNYNHIILRPILWNNRKHDLITIFAQTNHFHHSSIQGIVTCCPQTAPTCFPRLKSTVYPYIDTFFFIEILVHIPRKISITGKFFRPT